MKTTLFTIKGMHCASCAAIITKTITALPHVSEVSVNYGTEKATVEYDEDKTSLHIFNDAISQYGYTLQETQQSSPTKKDVHSLQDIHTEDEEMITLRNKVAYSIPITILMIILMAWDTLALTTSSVPNLPLPMYMFNIIGLLLATCTMVWLGAPYIKAVGRSIRYRTANMDTLIGIGTGTAFIYSAYITLFPPLPSLQFIPQYTYFDVTIVVLGFVTLGTYLEKVSKKKTTEAITALYTIQPTTACVIRNGQEVYIPIEDVKHGDTIVVKPGSRIPVDGIVIEGQSFVDESMITGEPMPVQKELHDTVLSGTMTTTGSLVCTATSVGSETMLARIIAMVEKAQNSKAPIQKMADSISSVFVPIVLGVALLTLIGWITIGSQYIGNSQAISFGILSFVGVLIIACPCALGLATPTALIVGIGKGAREGILIKDATTLETLHKVTTVVMDKTGTITKGVPTLIHFETIAPCTASLFLSVLVSIEKKSEHPIAHAITTYGIEHGIALQPVTNFEAFHGKGVKGIINGETYFIGNGTLMKEHGISFSTTALEQAGKEGKTPLIVATNTTVLGYAYVADEIKDTAKKAIEDIKSLGVSVVMLTGDTIETAQYIASSVGIDRVIAQSTPEDKHAFITSLQDAGSIVAMIGDGSNDAPALAQADVGIAVSTGTDIAIESAGITLLSSTRNGVHKSDIAKVATAIRLSHMTLRNIKQNLFWAFIYNAIGIPLAAGVFYPFTGWVLNPVFAGSAMALSSVSVILNSLRINSKTLHY